MRIRKPRQCHRLGELRHRHVFSTAGGGVAYVGYVCWNGMKAKGFRQGSPVVMRSRWIAAHEMGHQFGSQHTWNGTDGNCTPTSGAAIPPVNPQRYDHHGYAGLCGVDNTQARETTTIMPSATRGSELLHQPDRANCPTISNTATSADVNAGSDYTNSPADPFVLTASAATRRPSDHILREEMDYGRRRP
jgi:hypothetical protein